MADFTQRKRTTTTRPQVTVAATLPLGEHIFQLTTVDAAGNTSKPARIKVTVVRDFIRIDPRLVDPIVVDPRRRVITPIPFDPN
jgi:hypothetical protein